MKTIEKFLKESMLKHVAIELSNEDYIYEVYGEYDGCKELADYICNKIDFSKDKFNIKVKYDEVKDIQNIVFDELEIDFIKDSNESGYIPEKTTLINENKRFGYVYIHINDISKSLHSNHSMIEHELTHIFDDFMLQSKGLGSFLDLFIKDSRYSKSKEFNDHTVHPDVRELRRIFYLLNPYEENAFIAQLCNEIREIKDSYKSDIKDYKYASLIYNMTKDLDIYKAFEHISILIMEYENDELSEKDKKRILDEWNKLSSIKATTISQVFKKISVNYDKIKRKLESIIPKKICEDYLQSKYSIDGLVNFSNITNKQI